jgi:hypothetical protein
MRYVAQEDDLGCIIAASAMVFDLTYKEAARFIPLQRADDFQDGENMLADSIREGLEKLALTYEKEMVDLDEPPFRLKEGFRYIAIVPTGAPHLNHTVAVDETGIVFNPDSDSRDDRRHWSEHREHHVCSGISPKRPFSRETV